MSKYTFTFKKDDVFVEFTTEDREVVERQFQIWVANADDYVNNRPFKSVLNPSPVKQEEFTNKIPEQNPEIIESSSPLRTINTMQNPLTEEVEEKPTEITDFEEVLEQTTEVPDFERNRIKDQVFLNLVKTKNPTEKIHYLIITAYYLSEFEKMELFSLKQINAKLMNNLSEIIDHDVLQDAVNQNLLELVPDLTGTAEADEYRITRSGDEFFTNKI
ncbi:MAG: hypothetical protein PHC64_02510 [Candidatus Gastranaerophilales bacterium]|nr:hypothetical protein [Candidatus Gastranaerophilales bacterium]